MAKGSIAKVEVAKKLAEAFGENYIGEFDKKLYVWANDGGEQVQIAISMTCPKVEIVTENKPKVEKKSGGFDWSEPAVAPVSVEKAQISDAEKQTVMDLMAKLGL